MKKIIATVLFASAAAVLAPVANADPNCSNACVVDGDATVGDVTKGTETSPPAVYHNDYWPDLPTPKHPASFGPLTDSSGTLDDNSRQDMPSFTYSPSWGDSAESHDNVDIAGS